MIRTLLNLTFATTLATTLVISGCGRKTETHDPDVVPDTSVPKDAAQPTPPDTEEITSSEGQLICTPEWFKWVNEQVMNDQGEAIAEQFPNGLPQIGSDEWYNAMDRLTGGDGAHGPDGGSDEWCFMLQQRLSKTD